MAIVCPRLDKSSTIKNAAAAVCPINSNTLVVVAVKSLTFVSPFSSVSPLDFNCSPFQPAPTRHPAASLRQPHCPTIQSTPTARSQARSRLTVGGPTARRSLPGVTSWCDTTTCTRGTSASSRWPCRVSRQCLSLPFM